jgi:membrane protein implicated in regulation of membrane protease activity
MNNNFSISAKAVIKTALVIALTIFIFEFRVHIGFLLLLLAVLALLLGLLLLYAGTFQPATVKKYAEQAASSYAYLKALIDKTFNKQAELSSDASADTNQFVALVETPVNEEELALETQLGDTTKISDDEEYLV